MDVKESLYPWIERDLDPYYIIQSREINAVAQNP